jgi:c-di-AMP phosphodiesterase-like protein
MITNSKMADKNITHFTIFVGHSRPKYIANLKWLTKIANAYVAHHHRRVPIAASHHQ